MNMVKLSKIIVASLICLIAVVDIFLIVKGGTEATISHTMIIWSYEHPVFSFAMGFVMGHLFWRVRTTKDLKEKGL